MTELFGTMGFLKVNAALFVGWITLNAGIIPGLPAFDPFPFNLLTMTVSLEAIFLSIVVLISQNRASKVADVREQIDLQVNVQSEREVVKILTMLDRIQHRLRVSRGHDDPELDDMKQALDLNELEDEIIEDLRHQHHPEKK
ncbi:hypothetical protein A2856_02645 [Candidatus Uhrbacteria bacterium RIFCSPHIGHO2_01_FULL_63_20]|uniref:DUF1003 domain-containing protein n=1 Tax=Candidatus Uhrbacteria bacterium RIFCSPHIGHO2_01_FULL_63_20 TaxID=1802385 RepID=A0A1F7TKS1_9BACT|nr:MAG: hypothetical protein A2856_02645 [Candidatus Uhrbacteria bacterium RIFCSPHIGHO2_01_FULL_63_20]